MLRRRRRAAGESVARSSLVHHVASLCAMGFSRELAAAVPRIIDEMHRVNRLLDDGYRQDAIAQFHGLATIAIRTQRDDVACKGYMIQGRSVEISVCRIPAQPRPGKPIALFLPGLLAFLPWTAVRALAFVDLFDIVVCELPGHGASGEAADVSLDSFAAEYAALVDTALKRARGLTVIGESLGGLVALALGRVRPDHVRNVVLIDTPFYLTRPDLVSWIGEAWRTSGRRSYERRICMDIMGFDPEDGRVRHTVQLHHMVRNAPFHCAHIIGGGEQASGIGSVVDDVDIAALRAANPDLLVTPRVAGTGHAVLLDNPKGVCAALEALITSGASS